MPRVTIEPATAEDIKEFTANFYGEVVPIRMRVRALAGKVDGRVVAIGGIAFAEDGMTRIAFCDLSDEARLYPLSMHKAARMTMAMAMKLGIKRLVATTETNHPAARRWLERLDFSPRMVGGVRVYVRDF
jgi:hypothetical protein